MTPSLPAFRYTYNYSASPPDSAAGVFSAASASVSVTLQDEGGERRGGSFQFGCEWGGSCRVCAAAETWINLIGSTS